MPDETPVEETPVEAPVEEASKTVYETVKDLPPEKAVGAADVPSPVVVENTTPKVPSPAPEKPVKAEVPVEHKAEVAKSFDIFLRNRYGENDQLVRLWRKHASERLGVDLRG